MEAFGMGPSPNRLSSFTRINFPTRIFEYLAMHKPVIVPNTKGVQDYFGEDEILFFEAGNFQDLAAQIKWAFQNPAGLEQRLKKGRAIYEQHSWQVEEKRFADLVTNLITKQTAVGN